MPQPDIATLPKPEWNRRTPRLWVRLTRTAVCDLIILSMLLSGGEWAVRTFVPDSARLVYTPGLTGGHPYAFNSLGVRNQEFPVERPADETRILCLGDSTTLGAGVAVDEAYPHHLNQMLNESTDERRFLVINAGGQGVSLLGPHELLESGRLQLEPSLVVVAFSPSMIAKTIVKLRQVEQTPPDLETSQVAAPRASFKQRLTTRLREAAAARFGSCLYTLASVQYRKFLFRLKIRRADLDSTDSAYPAYAFKNSSISLDEVERAYDQFETTLAALRDELNTRDIALVVVGFPSRFEVCEAAVDNGFVVDRDQIRIHPLMRVADVCKRLDVPWADFTPVLSNARREMITGDRPWNDLFVEFDYAHFNNDGCRMAARTIHNFLLTHERLSEWRKRHLNSTRLERPATNANRPLIGAKAANVDRR